MLRLKRLIAAVAVAGVLVAGGVNIASSASLKMVLLRQRIRALEFRVQGDEAQIAGLQQLVHQAVVSPERVLTSACEPGDTVIWVAPANSKPGQPPAEVHLSC